MRFSKEERLEIGKKIYDGVMSRSKAAEIYGICLSSAGNYLRLYQDENGLAPKQSVKKTDYVFVKASAKPTPKMMSDYENMTKEELIGELVKARIAEARLKKGYMVKGDGSV